MRLNVFKQWWSIQPIFGGECTMDAAEEAWDYQQEKLDDIEKYSVKSNGAWSIIPFKGSQKGLTKVLNNNTGEVGMYCTYVKNGKTFFRVGNTTQYLDEFTAYATYIPFQISTKT